MFGNDKNDTYSGRERLKSISCESNIDNNYSDPSPSISNNSNILTKKSVFSDVEYIHTIIDDTDSCNVSRELSDYESNNSLEKSEVENQENDYLCSDGNDKNSHKMGQEKPFPLVKDEVNVIIHPLNNIEIENHNFPSNVIQIMKENHEIDSHAFLIAEKDNNKCSNEVKKSSVTINHQKFNDKLDESFVNNGNEKYDLKFVNEPNQINIQNVNFKIDDDLIVNNLDDPTNEKLEENELKDLIKSEIDKALERIFSDYDESEKKITDVSSDNVLKRNRISNNLECNVKECSDVDYEIKKKRLHDSSSRCIKHNQYSLSSDTGISNVDRVSNSNDINLSSDKAASNIVESDWIDISETSKSTISNSSSAKRYNHDCKIVKHNTGSNIISKQSECNIDILFFDSREDSLESFEDARSLNIASRQESGEVIEKTDHCLRNSRKRNSLLTDLKEEFMDSFADDFEVELNSLNSIKNDSVKIELTNNNSVNISEINNIEIKNETMNNSNTTDSNQLVKHSSQTAPDLVNIDKISKEIKISSERDNESLNSCLEDSVSETTMHSTENSQINSAIESSDIIKINKELLENIDNILVIVNTKTNSAENNLQETNIKEEITIPNIQSYEDLHFNINTIDNSLEAKSANSLLVEEIYESIKLPDNNTDLTNNENIISNETSDYDDNISNLLNYDNLNEALVQENKTLNVVLNYGNSILHNAFNYESNTLNEAVNYENTLNEAVNYENNILYEAVNYENNILNEAINYENNILNEAVNYENNILNEALNYENNTLNEALNYENNTLNEAVNYENNALNEALNYENNTLNEAVNYENNALNEAINYENNTLNEAVNYENNTLNEILNYERNTLNEELNYAKNTLNEVLNYANTSNEVLNNISNNLNEVFRGNNISNMLGYENYNLTEALVQENNTLNELLNYENNTLNEVLHNNSNNILDYENNTLNEVIDYDRTNRKEQINSNEVGNSIENVNEGVTYVDNGLNIIDIKTVSTSGHLNSKRSYENLKTTEYNYNEKHDLGSSRDYSTKIKDNIIVIDTKVDSNIKTEECSKINISEIGTKGNLNQDKIKDEKQRENNEITKDHLPLNNIASKAEHSKDILNYPKIENIKTSHHEMDTKFHEFDYKTLFSINNKNKNKKKEKKNIKLSDNLQSDNLTSVNKKLKKPSNNSLTANSSENLSDQIRVPWHEIFPNHKCHLHYPQRGIWWTCVHLVNYSRKSTQSNNIKK